MTTSEKTTTTTTMRAGRLDTTTSSLTLETVAIPDPGADEVRIKVAYAGICLTDLHFISGETAAGMPKKVTLGHEVSGVVDAIGSDVSAAAVGDRVVVHPVEESRTATRVLGVHYDGGWAEFLVAPAASLVHVDDSVGFDVAAIIPDAVATPWAAITGTAQVGAGESVALWGLGGLGYHAVKLLRLIGAAPIIAIDPDAQARRRASEAGADLTLDPTVGDVAAAIRAATHGRGVQVAFDFYGSESIHQAAATALARHGRMVLVGVPAGTLHLESSALFIRNSSAILGHYGSERKHIEELLDLIRHGRLDLTDSISATYDLSDVHEAVTALRDKTLRPVRILLRP